jgi:hypothetical protein
MRDFNLSLFERINLARCAAERADMNFRDPARFEGEYFTARLWTRYRIYNTSKCSFIEAD